MQTKEQAQQQFAFMEWVTPRAGSVPNLPPNIQTLWNEGRLTHGLRHAIYVKQLRRRWLFRVFPAH